MTNHYETVIIFSPLLSDDDVKREVSKYTKMVTDGGATILEERHWGLRQLSYLIEGKSNGIYYIMEFSGPGVLHQKLEIEFKRDIRDGRPKLLDINARAWGWHSIGARAGVEPSRGARYIDACLAASSA